MSDERSLRPWIRLCPACAAAASEWTIYPGLFILMPHADLREALYFLRPNRGRLTVAERKRAETLTRSFSELAAGALMEVVEDTRHRDEGRS